MLLMVMCAADELCDPANTDQTFVEELVRLHGCFLCYTPATGHYLTGICIESSCFHSSQLLPVQAGPHEETNSVWITYISERGLQQLLPKAGVMADLCE